MEIHQLVYFAEVIRQGNFTRAAERCHVSQPSLSQQVLKLEDELGQPLIRRTRQGALPTEFGQAVLARAQTILNELDAIKTAAANSASECDGHLTISAIPTIAPYCLPGLISACAQAYPGILLTLSEDTTDEMVAKLRQGQIDFGLLSPPFRGEQDLDTIHLGDDELLATLPCDHALTKRSKITLEDLAKHPIVLMKEAHCLRRQSISLCETSGIKPSVRIESSQLETVLSIVEGGHGFSFTPAMAVPTFKHRKLQFRSLSPKPVHRGICLVSQRQHTLPHTHRAFRELAQRMLTKQLHEQVKSGLNS